MNELALFAGAGGGILGGHLLGWRTVCAVEWESYPASVLCARQNDGFLPPFPVWDDVQTFDGKPWRGIVDVVSGGFPCQDISAAGKGAGIDGDRSGMWGEMARIIREVQPRYAFVENSPMLTSRGLGRVLGDLASMGFDARWGVLGAADVGANHQRDRIWICAKWRGQLPHAQHNRIRRWEQQQKSIKETAGNMANTNRNGFNKSFRNARSMDGTEQEKQTKESKSWGDAKVSTVCGSLANADSAHEPREKFAERIQTQHPDTDSTSELAYTESEGLMRGQRFMDFTEKKSINYARCTGHEWWQTEPDVGRVADGVAARVDRLKAIGNGQVPLCAATAWRILSEP